LSVGDPIDQGFDPPPLLFFFRRTVTKTAMMTMTMMMRTVERNASIYPKLEKLQEKGIPFESIKKKKQAHFPRVCNPEREKKARRKNRYIKSNSRSVFLSICASPCLAQAFTTHR